MSDKVIILSSAGLNNVILKQDTENEFEFIFGNRKIRMNKIFADFISPAVSKMHIVDPTINSIDFTDQINGHTFTDETLSLIQSLSKGSSIEIKNDQIFEIQIISILLDNDEIFSLVSKQSDSNINETNIDQYLTNLQFLYQISRSHDFINYSSIIEFISSHFHSIDPNKIISLPIEIIYSIVSNENLVVKSEDSLFEFIKRLFDEKKDDIEKVGKNDFYEILEFTQLTEQKFIEFLETFSEREMTDKLWSKLCMCFYKNLKNPPRSPEKNDKNRYFYKGQVIEYDGNQSHCFKGIINYLTEKCGGNVADKGVVNVTSFSTNGDRVPKNAVDLTNAQTYFQSYGTNYADWLLYDFVQNKVKPTHYTIRTRHDSNSHHPRYWVIEGSNTGGQNECEWTVLDSRQYDESLNGINVSHTFDISKKSNEGYRYIRLRQTGNSSGCYNHLTFSALEYFGALIEQ